MTGSSHRDYDNEIPGMFSVASFITRITSLQMYYFEGEIILTISGMRNGLACQFQCSESLPVR